MLKHLCIQTISDHYRTVNPLKRLPIMLKHLWIKPTCIEWPVYLGLTGLNVYKAHTKCMQCTYVSIIQYSMDYQGWPQDKVQSKPNLKSQRCFHILVRVNTYCGSVCSLCVHASLLVHCWPGVFTPMVTGWQWNSWVIIRNSWDYHLPITVRLPLISLTTNSL